jgi:hypothetical protein
VNGDGDLDSVYVGSSGVVVQLINANGSVISTNQFPIGFTPQHLYNNLVIADFDGDGRLDLAVTNVGNIGSSSGAMSILLGNGDGTFGAPEPLQAGSNPLSSRRRFQWRRQNRPRGG